MFTVEEGVDTFNLPRRAKRREPSLSPSPMASGHQRPLAQPVSILPKSTDDSAPPSRDVPMPAKRGRKPGPLSRAAREAQRRLNHSIIEKARRTKINEALATLKQLVPAQYGQAKTSTTDSAEEEEEEEDGEFRPGSNKRKKPGKKEEKEKEFKLEILVRTVAYMKDLIGLVDDLKAQLAQSETQTTPSCANCASKSRKRVRDEEDDPEIASSRSSRRRRRDSIPYSPPADATPVQSSPQNGPLPPISSWLTDSPHNARLLPLKELPSMDSSVSEGIPALRNSYAKSSSSHLPSPPSSTYIGPAHPGQLPPGLSLTSSSSVSLSPSASSSQAARTPEDESAASILLNIAARSSPMFQPMLDDSDLALELPSKLPLLERRTSISKQIPNSPPLSISDSVTNVRSRPMHAETPASLLGLRHLLRP